MGDSLVTPKEPVDPDEFEAVEATARPVYPGNVWEDTPYGEFADRCTKAAFIGILVDLDKAERAEEEWRTVETEDLVTPYRDLIEYTLSRHGSCVPVHNKSQPW